jgi:hypothetical protein
MWHTIHSDSYEKYLPVEVKGVRGVAFLDSESRDSRISPTYAAAGIDSSAPVFRDAEPIDGANSKAASSRIAYAARSERTGRLIHSYQYEISLTPTYKFS